MPGLAQKFSGSVPGLILFYAVAVRAPCRLLAGSIIIESFVDFCGPQFDWLVMTIRIGVPS